MSTLGILRRIPSLTANEQVFVAALVLALPLMAARQALSVEQYALSYALFYLAWYLLVRTTPPGRASLFTVGALFAASFTTNSLLPFYLVPMLHRGFDGYRGGMSAPRYLARYWPLLALPAGWFLAKLIFFQPYGLYVGYNAISPRRLLQATLLLCLVALPLGGVLLATRKVDPRFRGILTASFAGAFLIVLAVYPYIAVDKGPPFIEWETRNELLLPLGVALLVLAICRLARLALGRGAAQLMGMAVLASSLVLSASICASYLVDWQKQDALVGAFRRTPALESASTVVFRDETRSMNIFQRRYRFYEWNGLLKRAFGDETRFAVGDNPSQIRRLLTGRFKKYELYAARDYVAGTRVVLVTIRPRDEGSPWYSSLPVVSGLIPRVTGLQIQTRISTVKATLSELADGP